MSVLPDPKRCIRYYLDARFLFVGMYRLHPLKKHLCYAILSSRFTKEAGSSTMKKGLFLLCLMLILLSCTLVSAEAFPPLPMDGPAIGPAPKDECYISPNEYVDESIQVTISEGDYKGVHYTCARVKIQHPSQLRAVPANQVQDPRAVFSAWSTTTAKGAQISQASNAVVSINGDFYISADRCHVVMRQGIQVRNNGTGEFDVLVIDRQGNFDAIPTCTRQEYLDYYDAHQADMYQAFCFGPVLVKDGKNALGGHYGNGHMIADKKTQRVAIAQIGELDYMIITCDGDAIAYSFGLTIDEFADMCEQIGLAVQPEGFRLAFNLDGGNSATLMFKRPDANGKLTYQKLNMPERERDLADMICFVSLVK